MKALIQRVAKAEVRVDNEAVGTIGQGLLILLAIHEEDKSEDQDWLIKKILNLRIFADENQKMNLSVRDVKGEIMVISQFTLYASTRKGNRPSFLQSASPQKGEKMYKEFVEAIAVESGQAIAQGIFGADMQVELINDGPVTISIDTKNKH